MTASASPADFTPAGAAPARWFVAASDAFTVAGHEAPPIGAADVVRIAPDLDVWDAWPVQHPDGHPVDLGGHTLWMALAAPHFPDPDQRHGHARIHLLQRRDGVWADLGPAMPDGFSPGSREWSGSAVLDLASGELTLYFTATGLRGEAPLTFLQRLFRARATLQVDGGTPRLTRWRDLSEVAPRDAAHYMASDAGSGSIGTIKAYRDPAYFRDPADGRSHLLFAASAAGSASQYNGVIGLATATDDGLDHWQVQPPLVTADGFNNELERPHAIVHGGLYYLFWSTQRHVFDPAGAQGPNGLYGMVAESMAGPWQPLNGSGLVLANPATAPLQAYSWLVMPDLAVTSFIDDWGPVEPARERRFGATFAPMLHLALEGSTARLA
ncbi:glycoside hydrolase family 68 protein [Alteraurantiacibacter buctensis]|uniref:Glycoside hydrolase family 68 protein n=1 Tax=Alteraurantiacibacter buctensis TaxID=1503981 RepID=A0A844YT10_9SPHN|nr:glycoside hydrolase family 68 protein [Alteraurantiacibacter buctensis]MXO70232.1 glycoside hydrolase family 68 protein [Alteraurantiacibacter buctensis]